VQDATASIVFGTTPGARTKAAIQMVNTATGNSGGALTLSTSTATTLTERIRITSDGYLRMASGSGGIQFGGDTAAANALDDYEEGTFDVSVTFDGASAGITYGQRNFAYVKIGNTVYITGYVVLTNKGSSTGDARITGFPFTAAAGGATYSAFSLHINEMTFGGFPNGFITPSGSGIELLECSDAGVATNITNADFANTTGLIISGFYRT
jgi:hypothetical protein